MRGQNRMPTIPKTAKLISVYPWVFGVVLFEVEVALVVEHAVEHEGRVAVGALDRAAVEPRVVVGDEGVELECEVVETGAVGPLQHLLRHGEALPVAGRRRAVAPMDLPGVDPLLAGLLEVDASSPR